MTIRCALLLLVAVAVECKMGKIKFKKSPVSEMNPGTFLLVGSCAYQLIQPYIYMQGLALKPECTTLKVRAAHVAWGRMEPNQEASAGPNGQLVCS